jgi:hypothetical protein
MISLPAEPPRYAIRMPGGVGGLLSDGESYPDREFLNKKDARKNYAV